jgi:hypothetical protein
MGRKAHTTIGHFEALVSHEPNTGCWLWLGDTDKDGYGCKCINYRNTRAHRHAWTLYRGTIPNGHEVRHRCGVRLCVNPDHLTIRESMNAPTIEAVRKRFEISVIPEPNTGCWLWMGKMDARGYGMMGYGGSDAHATRISWMLRHGAEPPSDRLMCHRCDNPPCVNPDHLFVGTTKDNIHDCWRKGRGSVNVRRKDGSRPRSLKPHEVLEIRAKHAAGATTKALAEEYGMTPTNMRFIVNRKTWGYLQ